MKPRSPRPFLSLCLLALVALLPSCATITGTVTGAFTGFVDLPNEVVEDNELATDEASTWLVILVAAPVGFVAGPVFGFVKGIALDVGAISGNLTISEEFSSYGKASIWRPYTYGWHEGNN